MDLIIKKYIEFDDLRQFISISLILGVITGFAFGVAKGLPFINAKYFEFGMYNTAFYYFRSMINYSSLILSLIFIIAFLTILFIYCILTAFVKDGTKRKEYIHYAIIMMLFGVFLITLYRLTKSPWYPSFFSLRGFFYHAIVFLPFIFLALMIFTKMPSIYLYVGFFIALLLLVTNGYFYYHKSSIPVIFSDVAEGFGLRDTQNSFGVAWGDYNNDGWLDVYVSNHLPISAKSLLYQNKKGVFSAPMTMTSGDLHGVAWGDFDNDGDLDLFVAGGDSTAIGGPAFSNILFQNENGSFKDIASIAGVEDTPGRGRGGAWADFNNDGFLDIFVANYFTSNDLFLNNGDGTFKNVSKIAGITETDPGEANKSGTLCASWADFDGDGDMDLLAIALQTGIGLYRNNGNGTFTDVASSSGLVTSNYLGTQSDPRGLSGCAWGDYDNDGDMDLYVGGFGNNLLFQNQGDGTFIEVGSIAGVSGSARSRAVMWGDYDNDGDLDLYVINESSDSGKNPGWNALYLNQGNETFVDFTDATGAPGFPFVREATGALADYDNDGFIDIFINNQRPLRESPSYLKRNILLRNSGNGNNWLEIKLRGTFSNNDGIGSKVSLLAGDRHQFREQNGGSHTFAQNSMIIHFGLGRAKVVDRITVKWPSGITQTLTNVSANRIITIIEPAFNTRVY